MPDSSWEFLQIENEQLKTVQNNCYGQNYREATDFEVEVVDSKTNLRKDLDRVVKNSRLPLNLSINSCNITTRKIFDTESTRVASTHLKNA